MFCVVSDVCSIIYLILRHVSSRCGCGRATERNTLCPVLTTTYNQLSNLHIFTTVSMFIYCFNCLFSSIFSSTMTHPERDRERNGEKQKAVISTADCCHQLLMCLIGTFELYKLFVLIRFYSSE
jgi:hypothetical protein